MKRFLTGKQTVIDSKFFFAFIAFIIYSELETRKEKATLKQESLLKNDTINISCYDITVPIVLLRAELQLFLLLLKNSEKAYSPNFQRHD